MIQTKAVEMAIMNRFGLVKRDGWQNALIRAAVELGLEAKLAPEALMTRALCDATLLKKLVGHLTIPESYFFRNAEQLSFVEKHLKTHCLRGPNDGRLSVWSAGCSRGEELYSLAILFKEGLSPSVLHRIDLFGNDINGDVVLAARQAIYSDWHFRGLSDARRNIYFKTIGNGQFQLNDDIREMVTFVHCSIQERLAMTAPNSVDVVLFRNVGIYLSESCLDSLYRGFLSVLKPEGILCVAPSDPSPNPFMFERLVFEDGMCYQKSDHTKQMSPKNDPVGLHLSGWLEQLHGTTSSSFERCDAEDVGGIRLNEGRPKEDASELWPRIAAGLRALDDNDPKTAENIFRQALFDEPLEPVVRFWYALALFETKAINRSKAQLHALITSLEEMSPAEVLIDGTSTAHELLKNARVLLDKIEPYYGE